MKSIFISLYILVVLFSQSGDIENWKEEKNEKGIIVYTRNINGSDFKEFKGVVELEGRLSSMVAVLNDPDNFTSWVYNCQINKLLKGPNQKEQWHYMETYAPFPVDNRDMVYHYTFNQEPTSKEITVQIEGVPNYVPEKKGIVRMKKATGYYKFVPVNDKKIKVIYQLHVEPGGSVPAMIANQFVVDSPFYTLLKFREVAKDKKYSNFKSELVKD